MIGWETTIRTGNPVVDRQTADHYRQQAAMQGLALQEWSLPEGGLFVRVVPGAQGAARAVSAAPVGAHGGCQLCRAHGQTLAATLNQNVGLVVVRFPKTLQGQLCKACVYENGLRFQVVTALFGWWGLISFLYTLFSLPMNLITMVRASSLADAPGRPSSPASLVGAFAVTGVAVLGILLLVVASATAPPPP